MTAKLVYSSERGAVCPGCGHPKAECACSKSASAPQPGGPVRVGRETKGRKGKGVTVVTGLPLGSEELVAVAKQLKKRCGSGGTVRDGTIEIQGDHRDTLVAELNKLGYAVKRSGG